MEPGTDNNTQPGTEGTTKPGTDENQKPKTDKNTKQETVKNTKPGTDLGTVGPIIFVGMISIVALMTLGGLLYMCKTNCECQCCCKCKNLEKMDVNQIYGEYYYDDGRRRATEMEFRDNNPVYGKN